MSSMALPTHAEMMQFSILSLVVMIMGFSSILFKSAEYIGTGSEKLLLLYGSGVVGGLVIPILGAVPDGSMVLFSGLGPCAQVTLNIGIGTLAGSTIMLVTIPFAMAMFLGRRDLDPSTGEAATTDENKPKYENGFSWKETVITTGESLPVNAKIMIATGSAYLFVLIPAMVYRNTHGLASHEHYPVLGGILTCAVGFIGYAVYQTVDGKQQANVSAMQERAALQQWQQNVGSQMAMNANSYATLFKRADKDGNDVLDREELASMLHMMGLSETSRGQILDLMEAMPHLDEDHNTCNLEEFEQALAAWGGGNQQIAPAPGEDRKELMRVPTDVEVVESLWGGRTEEEPDMEEFELHLTDRQITMSAVGYLLLGTALTLLFSGPMVTAISAFSAKTHMNPFFVSFFLTPLAGNIAEIYAALLFARKKCVSDISLAVSSLYGAACLNNTFVLGVFCTLVFAQKLAWTYTIEAITIMLTLIVVGFIGRKVTMTMFDAAIIFSMFPLSVILIGALQRPVDGPPVIPPGCVG